MICVKIYYFGSVEIIDALKERTRACLPLTAPALCISAVITFSLVIAFGGLSGGVKPP